MSVPPTLQPSSLNASGSVSGKNTYSTMLDGRTITFCGKENFKSEKFRDMYHTVLTDVKNLNKARKVVWNDTQGKTGVSGIKQIFSNIKHNIRAAWMGKKGELKASEQLKADIKRFEKELFKEDFDGDGDFFKDCKNFYSELKGNRPDGYAGTKETLMQLIGNINFKEPMSDEDKAKQAEIQSLKKDVETFLRGDTNTANEFFEVETLVQRFKKVSSGDAKQFGNLLTTYKAGTTEETLKNDINSLFETEWLDAVGEKKCRDIDTKRDELIKSIEDFVAPAQEEKAEVKTATEAKTVTFRKKEFADIGMGRLETDDYQFDYYLDKTDDGENTDDGEKRDAIQTQLSLKETAIEQLKEKFKSAFPEGDTMEFAYLLEVASPKNKSSFKQLKELVTHAATAEKAKIKKECNEAKAPKENVKNGKPTSEEAVQKDKFLEELPLFLKDKEQVLTDRKTRIMGIFDRHLSDYKEMRARLESLLDARKAESNFSVFNRLEQMLETIMAKDDGFVILEEEQEETSQQMVDSRINPSAYV